MVIFGRKESIEAAGLPLTMFIPLRLVMYPSGLLTVRDAITTTSSRCFVSCANPVEQNINRQGIKHLFI